MRPGAPRRGGPPPASSAITAAMAGAVDLAAVKARSEAAARAADAPAPAAGSYVLDLTEASFQSEVIDRSFQVPVLLVVTSDRVPTARPMISSMETLVNAQAGRLVLGKVDLESNPRIAQALQVQAVPCVFAIIGGQVIPGFEGVLPEAQITQFVDAVLKAGQDAGLAAAEPGAQTEDESQALPEPPADPRFTAAEAAIDAGDYALAAQHYQSILDAEPANQDAMLALGNVRLLQRIESVDPALAQRADAAPADVDAQLAAADLSFASGDVQGSLDRLLRTVGAVSGDDRDEVRQRLLEYFDLLGPDDPRVPPARRALTRTLF